MEVCKVEEKRKRMTRQKRIVYDILCCTDSHPAAEWIYCEARKMIPDISLGTVYRNLQVLEQEHQISRLNYGKEQSRYDGNVAPHGHFVCSCCNKVLDFYYEPQVLESGIMPKLPGNVKYHRLECYGVCNDCLNENIVL